MGVIMNLLMYSLSIWFNCYIYFIYCYFLSSATMCWIDVAYTCNRKQHTNAVDYWQNGTRTGIHLIYLTFPYTYTNPGIAPPSCSDHKVCEEKFSIIQYMDLPPTMIHCHKLQWTKSGAVPWFECTTFKSWFCIFINLYLVSCITKFFAC